MRAYCPPEALPENVQLETKPCPLGCPLDDEVVIASAWDRISHVGGRFQVVRCRTCGLMRTNPRPTPDTIRAYYPDDYGPYQGTKVDITYSMPMWKRIILRALGEFRASDLPLDPPGKMLEIGCASGKFLHQMAQQGWAVQGIEFSSTAAQCARSLGYSVYSGGAETAPPPVEPVDLIVGWMVLEHLHQPLLVLQRLYDWTRPGGWLVISVPDASSWEFALFKDKWYALHVPAHLFFYTPTTLDKILRTAGWHMERVIYQPSLRNVVGSLENWFSDIWGQEHFVVRLLSRYHGHGGRWELVLRPLTLILARLKLTGRITIWARKS